MTPRAHLEQLKVAAQAFADAIKIYGDAVPSQVDMDGWANESADVLFDLEQEVDELEEQES